MEDRKIKIRKKTNFNQSSDKAKTSKSLELLEKTVKKIENKYKVFGFSDSKEEEFFENYQGKDIIIEISNGETKEGSLTGIDKFRICLTEDKIKKYYFKHSIICYYAK